MIIYRQIHAVRSEYGKKQAHGSKKYFLFFMIYSIIGWIYEEFLEIFVYGRGLTDRGILTGPYCPIYGVGSLLFLFTVYHIIKNKPIKKRLIFLPVIFVLCMLIATAVELLSSYLCEAVVGYIPWDYTLYRYNFQARIALSPSLRFGLGGVLFLYIVQPALERLFDNMKDRLLNIIFYTLALIFAADWAIFIINQNIVFDYLFISSHKPV